MYLLSKVLPKFILTVIFIMSVLTFPVSAGSIWDVGSGESRLEGELLSCRDNHVHIGTKSGIRTLPLSSQPFVAMTGSSGGYIINPADFPLLIKVELVINKYGKVRAMRNKQETIATPTGQELAVSGHDAILSPDGENYLLFHMESGLFLYSLENKYAPIFLGESSIAAWDPGGSKIACFHEEKILIYDVFKQSKTLLSLPAAQDGLVHVLTGLEWSPDGKNLLYTALEDYPDLDSNVFCTRILDLKGSTLQTKYIINMVKATWQKKDQILFVCASDISQDISGVFQWDLLADKTSVLLPFEKGAYRNTAYNPGTDCLAYTTAAGFAEDLYVLDFTRATKTKIMSLPFPVYNLQWTKKNTLLFSEDFNSIIYEVNQNDSIDNVCLIAQATGYLPVHGAAKGFVYFLAEPFEEPQPLFLNKLKEKVQAGCPD